MQPLASHGAGLSTTGTRYSQSMTNHLQEQGHNEVDFILSHAQGHKTGQATHQERNCMRMPLSHALIVLDGELPKFARFTFIYLVERARRLLANCDIEMSKENLDELDWFPLILDPDRFMPEASEKLREIEPHERDATQPSLVYQHMQDFDQDDLKGYSWSEYFALMALNCISQIWLYEGIFDDVDFNESKYIRSLQNTLAHFTAEAAEAVTLGEQLLERESGNVKLCVSKKPGVHNSATVNKRDEKIAQLKQEFFTHYDTDDFLSQAAAVRKYLGELTNEDRKLLVPTKAERTLLGALRTHLATTSDVNGNKSVASGTRVVEPGDVE